MQENTPIEPAHIYDQTYAITMEVVRAGQVQSGQLLVVGASTSEVIGSAIGTQGRQDIARAIVEAVERVAQQYRCGVAYQCCEHLNRALVVASDIAQDVRRCGDIVSVVPTGGAGGALATEAYAMVRQAVVVEGVRAEAGIDIGETLIGMHLRPVAVPFRPTIRTMGWARVTAATTRPRLIGGARAVYRIP